jgi:hypothetical protein
MFILQPPWDLATGKNFIIHYTYGCDYNLKVKLYNIILKNNFNSNYDLLPANSWYSIKIYESHHLLF